MNIRSDMSHLSFPQAERVGNPSEYRERFRTSWNDNHKGTYVLAYNRHLVILMLFLTLSALPSCSKEQAPPIPDRKLVIVTTLFPLYDFARSITGDRAEVSLLLPPGAEPHSYEPRPGDIVAVEKADLLIYTGTYMEPWAEGILKGLQSRSVLAVDASQGIRLRRSAAGHTHSQQGHRSGDDRMDPHLWLDFSNAMAMVDIITAACASKDPAGAEIYRRNGESYKALLHALDREYAGSLSKCRTKTLLHGGHFAFNYMASRYGLTYLSAYKGSPDAEPTPQDIAAMAKTMKQQGLRYLFYEELLSPRVAEAIAGETGAGLLKLHAAHNVTRDELQQKVSFLSLMRQNLASLKTGLQCP